MAMVPSIISRKTPNPCATRLRGVSGISSAFNSGSLIFRLETHSSICPRLDKQELHAETLVIIHVHRSPIDHMKRRRIAAVARGIDAVAGLIEVLSFAKTETDVHHALVADAISARPWFRDRLRILPKLDKNIAGPEQVRFRDGAFEVPEFFMFRPVKNKVRAFLKPDGVDKEAPGTFDIRNRNRNAARDHRNAGPQPRSRFRAALPGIFLHEFDDVSFRIPDAHATDSPRTQRFGQQRNTCSSERRHPRVEIRHMNSNDRVARVVRCPVLRTRFRLRSRELEHLQLQELLLIDHPSSGHVHVRQTLNPGAEGISEIICAAAWKKSQHVLIPAPGALHIENAEGELIQRGWGDGSTCNGPGDRPSHAVLPEAAG